MNYCKLKLWDLQRNRFFITIVLFLICTNFIWTQSQSLWTGDGGKDIRVTVSEPTGKGLSVQEQALLPLIQSTIIGSFQRFSAMTVFDRQNLENVLREQNLSLSGNFSDTDYIRIGNLTQARLVVFGSISKTSNNYMLELAVTDVESGQRKASYLPRPVSLSALENLSAIREASADLLGQLGVNLTANALQELKRTENTTRIQAENALARGIAAQRQGTTVDALTYFFEAATFDPSVMREAINRVSVVSADISGGDLGQAIRNRLQEHDDWRAIVQAANSFYLDHLPYELVYSTDINQGSIDFEKRTTGLSIGISLIPTEAWKTINDLRQGLRKARSNDPWKFSLDRIEPRQIAVTIRILNENNKVLSTESYTFSNPSEKDRTNATLTFRNVRADDITDRLRVEVISINGKPAQSAGETGFIQIIILSDYDRRQAQIKAAEDAARREREAAEATVKRQQEAARRQLEAAEVEYRRTQEERELKALIERGKRRNNLDVLFIGQFKEGNVLLGCLIGFYWSPFPFISIGLDTILGGFIDNKNINTEENDTTKMENSNFYGSVAPVIGLITPFGKGLQFFSNFIFEMGNFGHYQGLFNNWITPGFDVGINISALLIKYKGTWYNNSYANSVCFGISWPFSGKSKKGVRR